MVPLGNRPEPSFPKEPVIMYIKSSQSAPIITSFLESVVKLRPGSGHLTCCSRNHLIRGKTVEYLPKMGKVLRHAMTRRIAALKSTSLWIFQKQETVH